MSDEIKTDAPTEEPKDGKVVFESQADFDAVITRRLAKEKEKYADYNETKEQLEKLRQAQKEAEEKELSEVEKYKKQLDEVNQELETYKPYKEKLTAYEQTESDEIEKLMDENDFTEEQKLRYSKLDIPDRRAAVKDLIAIKTTTPPGGPGKGAPGHNPTKDSILAMPDGPAKMKAWGEYRSKMA